MGRSSRWVVLIGLAIAVAGSAGAASGAGGDNVQIDVGQGFLYAGSDLGCQIDGTAQVPDIICGRFNGLGLIPSGFAIRMTAGTAQVLKITNGLLSVDRSFQQPNGGSEAPLESRTVSLRLAPSARYSDGTLVGVKDVPGFVVNLIDMSGAPAVGEINLDPATGRVPNGDFITVVWNMKAAVQQFTSGQGTKDVYDVDQTDFIPRRLERALADAKKLLAQTKAPSFHFYVVQIGAQINGARRDGEIPHGGIVDKQLRDALHEALVEQARLSGQSFMGSITAPERQAARLEARDLRKLVVAARSNP